ncbi:MAG: ATP-dependent Clp protease ATP-binding subunit ClpX [Candidatus Marinimicrobia bacterium]|nr:ATP-dependent Clp protease ATP-binding subunit ClpX [Candidatus Neomarinimicrobiota bacterium]
MKTTKDKKITCSFCGLSQSEVNLLVEGESSYICNFCIIKSSDLLSENLNKNSDCNDLDIKAPALIKKELDSFIIDQEKAKKIVSVAVYNHYKRLSCLNRDNDITVDKSNILLVGPTGTGKTLIAKTLAKVLNVPFVIVDATVLTEAGYVGEDVENILVRLYHESNYDIEKTQQGIIYIDEIDKIAKRDSNVSITRDVSGEGVQQSLLKIIEGTVANIPPQGGRKHPEQPLVKIDTSNILFICGGTFAGLSKVIDRRIRGGGIGFDRKIAVKTVNQDLLLKMTHEDIVQFGFIPELIGRLPILSPLKSLSFESMKSIFCNPDNAILKQYQYLFSLEDIELIFTDNAINEIVRQAMDRKTGARALRSVIEEVMLDIMYDIPSQKNIKSCTINLSVVNKKSKPKLSFYKKTA